MKQYRIIGRFAKDEEPHTVDFGFKNLQDAKRRLAEIIDGQTRERKVGYGMTTAGVIGVRTPYLPEYELKDLKIQVREVTAWTDEEVRV